MLLKAPWVRTEIQRIRFQADHFPAKEANSLNNKSRILPPLRPRRDLGCFGRELFLFLDWMPYPAVIINGLRLFSSSGLPFSHGMDARESKLGLFLPNEYAFTIHLFFGFSAPYFDLPLLRSGIPSKSLTPRIQWNFTPGESLTLPPLIKTIGCSCKL